MEEKDAVNVTNLFYVLADLKGREEKRWEKERKVKENKTEKKRTKEKDEH